MAYLNYRARIAPYQQALHARQMEGYLALSDLTGRCYLLMAAVPALRAGKIDEAQRAAHTLAYRKLIYEVYESIYKWGGILPHLLLVPLKHFYDAFTDQSLLAVFLGNGQETSTLALLPEMKVYNALLGVITAVRSAVGVDSLGNDTLTLLGVDQRLLNPENALKVMNLSQEEYAILGALWLVWTIAQSKRQ